MIPHKRLIPMVHSLKSSILHRGNRDHSQEWQERQNGRLSNAQPTPLYGAREKRFTKAAISGARSRSAPPMPSAALMWLASGR